MVLTACSLNKDIAFSFKAIKLLTMKKYLLLGLLLPGCITYTDKPPVYAGIDITGRPQFIPITENQLIDYDITALQNRLIDVDKQSELFKAFLLQNHSDKVNLINALTESEQANRRLYNKIVNL